MKSKFWLLLLISCLVSLILFSSSNIVTAKEGGEQDDSVVESKETPKLVVQGENKNYDFTKDETEKIKATKEQYQFEVYFIFKLLCQLR